MALDEIKKNIVGADLDLRSYMQNNTDYFMLKGFKILMRSITLFAQIIMVGSILFLALLFLSLAASFSIGEMIGSQSYGLLIIGMGYLVIGIICYLLKDRINKPLIKTFSKYYFDKQC